MRRKKISIIIKSLVSIVLILFLCLKIDIIQIKKLTVADVFPYLSAGVIITLAALLIMSYRWKILIKEFLHRELSIRTLYTYYLIGTFFNTLMPGAIGGDIIRTERLHKRHGLSLKACTAITIAERMAGIYGLMLLLSISIAIGNYPDSFTIRKHIPQCLLLSTPVLVILLIPLIKKLLRSRNVETSYSFMAKTVAVLLLSQMGDILIAWVLSEYFNLHIGFYAFLFIMPLVYVATVLPISLGGLGVREGTFSGLMTLYGVEISTAVTISLFMYLIKLCTGIIGYITYICNK